MPWVIEVCMVGDFSALFDRFMVGLAGLEPAARGLGNLCSIRLSYRPIPWSHKLTVAALIEWFSLMSICCLPDVPISLSGAASALGSFADVNPNTLAGRAEGCFGSERALAGI